MHWLGWQPRVTLGIRNLHESLPLLSACESCNQQCWVLGQPLLHSPTQTACMEESLLANSYKDWLNMLWISSWQCLLVLCFSSLNWLKGDETWVAEGQIAQMRNQTRSDGLWVLPGERQTKIHSTDSCCHRLTEMIDGPQTYCIEVWGFTLLHKLKKIQSCRAWWWRTK